LLPHDPSMKTNEHEYQLFGEAPTHTALERVTTMRRKFLRANQF
jgi:hypothetical protein